MLPTQTSQRPPLRAGGLFAGIGGIERGLEFAQYETVLLAEVHKPARAVLSEHFGKAELLSDVREVDDLPKLDLLSAGFPCSDLSQAGRTAGISGASSGLVGEVFRLLDGASSPPTWLLLENVPFMLALDRGAAMTWLTRQLTARGYRWAYRTVDSRAFGLPQRRRRVVLLASRERDPRPVLLNPDVGEPPLPRRYASLWRGFYWTEGNRGTGLIIDAVPPLKSGSSLGIASPPAVWLPNDGTVVTPDIRDAERLQGFDAEWTLPAGDVAPRPGERWRLVGNAVSVPVARWAGERMRTEESYDFDADEELQAGERWPWAAWGDEGQRRFKSDVSMWPVLFERPHLHDFLEHPTPKLSPRASSGFHLRASRSNLKVPKSLLKALERQSKQDNVSTPVR